MDQQTQEAINTIGYAISALGLVVASLAENTPTGLPRRDMHENLEKFAEGVDRLNKLMESINGQ